jgi:hypothetical protein
MMNLLFIFTTLAFLIGFFAFVGYEERRGARIFAGVRTRFDQNIERVEFILAHVDFAALLFDEMRRFASHLMHGSAHLSLLAVRAIERVLTRIVRNFRTQHEVNAAPRESTRGYVKTLSDFKGRLKATHPQISDIQ